MINRPEKHWTFVGFVRIDIKHLWVAGVKISSPSPARYDVIYKINLTLERDQTVFDILWKMRGFFDLRPPGRGLKSFPGPTAPSSTTRSLERKRRLRTAPRWRCSTKHSCNTNDDDDHRKYITSTVLEETVGTLGHHQCYPLREPVLVPILSAVSVVLIIARPAQLFSLWG